MRIPIATGFFPPKTGGGDRSKRAFPGNLPGRTNRDFLPTGSVFDKDVIIPFPNPSPASAGFFLSQQRRFSGFPILHNIFTIVLFRLHPALDNYRC